MNGQQLSQTAIWKEKHQNKATKNKSIKKEVHKAVKVIEMIKSAPKEISYYGKFRVLPSGLKRLNPLQQ